MPHYSTGQHYTEQQHTAQHFVCKGSLVTDVFDKELPGELGGGDSPVGCFLLAMRYSAVCLVYLHQQPTCPLHGWTRLAIHQRSDLHHQSIFHGCSRTCHTAEFTPAAQVNMCIPRLQQDLSCVRDLTCSSISSKWTSAWLPTTRQIKQQKHVRKEGHPQSIWKQTAFLAQLCTVQSDLV